MAENIQKKIQSLQIDVANIVNEIKKLSSEGGDAQKKLTDLAKQFNEAIKQSVKLSSEVNKNLSDKEKLQALTKVNSALSSIISSQNTLTNSVKQSNEEYEKGFQKLLTEEKRISSLKEEIALRNIQLSNKENVDKLQDVVNYYSKLQGQYKQDSEEFLKIEKKKIDAQIALQKESDKIARERRERDLKIAFDEQKKNEQKLAAEQKALRDKIAAGNKARSKKVTDFFNAQEKRRADFFERKEREKTATLKTEEKKRTNAVEEEAKKRDFAGGFRGQLTPRAIGGALGSLTKYLGLYQLINAAQRLFTELTLGSVKQSIAFQKELANLGAVAGVAGNELEKLGKNALEVAGSTKFTATEIIGLQTELSKLGFSAEEVISATEGIAFTAQALGAPLDAVAEQTGKVINQFGLLVEEAGFVGDVLVTTINNSALSFDSFGTAIQYVGPIARDLGLSFEQTAGAMAVLTDNGFTASRVGTGLRGIFTELGKTSADVEASLRSLAEQNISLSEAVDLVGKRNAAQLITLLDNIDALDEGTERYYEQGRALSSAAQQIDTFDGQLGILNSNFRQFQIEIGNSIVESDALIRVLDLLFREAANVARGFQGINEIGFESFSNGAKDVSEGADATKVALEKLGISYDDYLKAVKNVNEQAENPFISTLKGIDPATLNEQVAASELVSKVNGLRDALDKESEVRLKRTAILRGEKEANNLYEESVKKLTEAHRKGVNVNEEANSLFREIGDSISFYNDLIGDGTKITERQRSQYDKAIETLKKLQNQVNNATIGEEELQERRKKLREQAVREEKKRIQDAIRFADIEFENQVKNINEIATLQKIRQQQIVDSESSTAEERTAAINKIADIEEQRQQDVSAAYRRKAVAISQITIEYEENEDAIDKALLKAIQFSEILDSNVVEDAANTLKAYRDEAERLEKSFKDGDISLKEFNNELDRNQEAFAEYIEELIKSNNLGDEAEGILRNMVKAYNEVGKEVDGAKKSLDDFKKEFKKETWAEIAKQITDGISEALNEFNRTAAENTKNRLDSDLDSIKNRYKIEEDVLKASLQNRLISESQYRQKQEELRRSQLAEENTINRQIFDSEKKQDINNARIEGLEAAAQAYLEAFKEYEPATAFIVGSIGAGIATAQSAAQIQAINQRKFFPKKFAEGGMVYGPSHSEGGVPFSVNGQGGYEMEGGEFIVNKDATMRNYELLKKINNSTLNKPRTGNLKFAQGGLVNSPVNESVDYLKAIAEATTSTAIGVSKPVRAYVSDKDLRSNATERRIRERNDRL